MAQLQQYKLASYLMAHAFTGTMFDQCTVQCFAVGLTFAEPCIHHTTIIKRG
jgi:hypothetical protein